jgi:hypothetical protein
MRAQDFFSAAVFLDFCLIPCLFMAWVSPSAFALLCSISPISVLAALEQSTSSVCLKTTNSRVGSPWQQTNELGTPPLTDCGLQSHTTHSSTEKMTRMGLRTTTCSAHNRQTDRQLSHDISVVNNGAFVSEMRWSL